MGLFSWFKPKQQVPLQDKYFCNKCGYGTPFLQDISYHYCTKEINMDFKFKTKEEYFTYRKEWKNRYNGIIAEIRKAAIARRDAERIYSANIKDYWYDLDRHVREANIKVHHEMHTAAHAHRALKAAATELLNERAASKEESCRQWELKHPKAA